MRALTLKMLRDTASRKGQFIALVALITIGIMSYVTFQNGYYNLRASLDRAYSTLRFAQVTAQVDRAPFSATRAVEALPGVASARVRTIEDVGLERGDGERATARIVSSPEGNATDVNRVVLERGRFAEKPDEAVLNTQFSSDTGVDVGDTIELRVGGERRTLHVVGVGTDPEYLYALRSEGDLPAPGSFAVLFVTETAVEKLFGRHGWGNDVAVRLQPGVDPVKAAEEIEDVLEPYGVRSTTPENEQPGWVGLDSELSQNRIMAQMMPALVLAISAMSLFIALSRIVQAQRGQIGLAKALGYSDAQLLWHYLSFALIVAAVGTVLGIAGGLAGARGIAGMYVSMLGLPFMESGFYPHVALIAVGLAVGTCALAAVVPAWRSARIAPAIAMHSDPNVSLVGGHIPLVERVLSPVLPRSFTFRVPLRNVFRARRRSAYTVLGIAFAMVLSVATISMFDSINHLMDVAFTQVEKWDLAIAYVSPVDNGRIAEVRRLDGVTGADAAFVLPVSMKVDGRTEDVMLTAMAPDAAFHGFQHAGGSSAERALENGEIVLASATAERLGIEAGAEVTLDSPLIDDPIRMRVGSLSDEILGQPAYLSLDAAATLVGHSVTSYNALYVYADPRKAESIEDALYDMPGSASVQIKAGLYDRLKAMMKMFDFFGDVLLVFGGALAFVVVFTTFTANVTERTREIATMRTIGEDNMRISLMITIENLLLTIAALPLGVWLGVRAMDAIFKSFETESYSIQAYVSPASILRVSLLMIAVVLLSEIGPVRRIFRLDLAEATKVME